MISYLLDFLEQLTCSHDYRFLMGQRVYMTKGEYDQRCQKCFKLRKWQANIMAINLEDELERTGQVIHDGIITEPAYVAKYESEKPAGINYRDHYIYQVRDKLWRVKTCPDDSFALHDGYIATLEDAKAFVDGRIKNGNDDSSML